MNCQHCGYPLSDGAKFCTICGQAQAPAPEPWAAPVPDATEILSDPAVSAAPAEAWNQPAAPVNDWAQPAAPVNDWTQPAAPVNDWTQPAAPVNDWVPPAAPGNNWAPPAAASEPWNAPPSSYKPAAEPQKKKGPVVALIVIIALLVIALIVTLFLFVLPSINKPEEKKDEGSLNIDYSQNDDTPAAEDTEPEIIGPALDNPYRDCYLRYTDYVLPESDSQYICYQDLINLSERELAIATQEIYARQGKTFNDADVQEYFDNRSWYRSGGTFRANKYEKANLELLEVYESVQNGSWEYSGNPYINVCSNSGDYANPHSHTRYLTANELKDLSAIQLELMRNEIFARRGAIFGDDDLRLYFYSMPWFKGTGAYPDDFTYDLNQYERANAKLILIYEKRLRGVQFSSGNPYRQYYSAYRDYVIYYSDSNYLSEYDIYGMTADQLCLARNEILARHGYTFGDDELFEYFMQFDWYLPNTPEGDGSSIRYNSVELANVDFLKDAEEYIRNHYHDYFYGFDESDYGYDYGYGGY